MMQYFIAYFPYLFMGEIEEIDLGFAKVWNYDKKKKDYIKNPELIGKVDSLLGVYSTHTKPTRGIGIISFDVPNLLPFSDEQASQVQTIRSLLFLALLSENNTAAQSPNAHSMVTSENFDVIYQNFTLGSDALSETAGAIITFRRGGFKTSEIKLPTPTYVSTISQFRYDDEILSLLLRLKNEKPLVFRRVMSANRIFMEGYYNSPYLSQNGRILLLISAFEILFSLPEEGQRKNLKAKIESISALDTEKKYESYWSRNEKRQNQPKEFLTRKGQWAEDFYLLRNSIIHGSSIRDRDFFFLNSQQHIHIAPLFFVLAIRKQLEKSLRNYHCDQEIQWSTWIDDVSDIQPFKVSGFRYTRMTARAWLRALRRRNRRIN